MAVTSVPLLLLSVQSHNAGQQQHINVQPDGSIILTMETPGSYDVKRWAMSFSSDAELLEPVDLRKEIAEELRKALS